MGVFIEVKRVIRPGDGSLKIAQNGVDPVKAAHVGTSAGIPDHLSLVATPVLGDSPETIQAVRDNEGRRSQVGLGPSVNIMVAEGCHAAKNHSKRMAVMTGFHRSNKWHLILRTASDLASQPLSAKIGVIDLNPLGQDRSLFPFEHGLHELVLKPPSLFVAQPQHPSQLQDRLAGFALGHEIDRQKPLGQRQVGPREDRSRDQRRLLSAAFALKDLRPTTPKGGQTGVYDRGYQCYKNFDDWRGQDRHFVCRNKASSRKTVLQENPVDPDSHVFYDAVVLLGTREINQTEREVRVVGYKADGKNYWVPTDRFALSAEQIALIYKLRWTIESFFGWWKRHLKVYHLIARSPYGLLMQILSGLITYLLLAIYCHKEHGERVSIRRVREFRNTIRDEAAEDAAAGGLSPLGIHLARDAIS